MNCCPNSRFRFIGIVLEQLKFPPPFNIYIGGMEVVRNDNGLETPPKNRESSFTYESLHKMCESKTLQYNLVTR